MEENKFCKIEEEELMREIESGLTLVQKIPIKKEKKEEKEIEEEK